MSGLAFCRRRQLNWLPIRDCSHYLEEAITCNPCYLSGDDLPITHITVIGQITVCLQTALALSAKAFRIHTGQQSLRVQPWASAKGDVERAHSTVGSCRGFVGKSVSPGQPIAKVAVF